MLPGGRPNGRSQTPHPGDHRTPSPSHAAPLGLAQPTVSHHLRILTEAGLLERAQHGVLAYYRLMPSAIAAIADSLTAPRKRATKKAR
ncbi:helix-turn-helix transcriptional regulator [Micromonospora sp. AP08]|nr:helix-turn-helix transcriptional regulator [Micromonospora sp. AP08]